MDKNNDLDDSIISNRVKILSLKKNICQITQCTCMCIKVISCELPVRYRYNILT